MQTQATNGPVFTLEEHDGDEKFKPNNTDVSAGLMTIEDTKGSEVREPKATDETLQMNNGEDMDRSGEIVVGDNESFDLSSSDEDEDGKEPKEAFIKVGVDDDKTHELSENNNSKFNMMDERADTPPSGDTHEKENVQLDINNDTSGDEMVIDDSDGEMILSDGD